MQSIVLVLLLIVCVDLSRSSEVISEIDGFCQCENIDGSKYDSDEFRTEAQYRVLNGTIVRPSELPWQVNVYLRYCGIAAERPVCESPEDYHYFGQCSGVLISPRFVLTAGHVCKSSKSPSNCLFWPIKIKLTIQTCLNSSAFRAGTLRMKK